MDQPTLDYYKRSAGDVAARYRAANTALWRQRFPEAFPAGARIADVGSASGRDLALMQELGFDVHGFEPSEAMRQEALHAFPNLAGKLDGQALPFPEEMAFNGTFDGVVCSAVLMHVPEAELFDAAFSLKRLLKEKGRLLISVPVERSGLDPHGRDEHGRLFHTLYPEYLTLLFERLGLQLVRKWEDADRLGRADVRWNTFLFELDSARGRPLDRIERVLNQDRKTATYKLALFRALSEIGTVEHHRAQWISDEEVAVPIGAIAEKWFRYYWPLFEATEFIPQNNGETAESKKPVAFRKRQSAIIASYRSMGGLSQFLVDEESGELPPATAEVYGETLRSIRATIKDGPVVYASGKMFRYDGGRQAVIVEAKAWREFCQLGHWIEPAVLLRWAEETHRMSGGRVPVSDVLNRLVVSPTEERRIEAAKQIYEAFPEKRCVWSDKALGASFAVDHVIPFSLWHCNDLWNLLPCDMKVNGKKSDKLPERGLLFQRRDSIVGYWELMRDRHERRFDRELTRFSGTELGANWQNGAFRRLVEAIETTAILRGAERWRP